ncbi:MAG: Quinolinate synthetase [Candidatus Kapaibacterium sp.]|nr:MAG: Quinolinate synthetase [Candidatus Kapabacteria bacterium]ROL58595.1 MAG: quinolinate synthase NadA [Bacteroidetes/Chlorobi group bacterium Naka2016]
MENIVEKINRLKKEKNAIILAHYYQDPSIQDVADFLGDSLALAQAAQKTNADVIVFCGVHFMAETAKILNPDKIVVMPDLNAGCSLADSAPADKFKKWVEEHPGHTVISYINCSAEVKALSDIICTSSNAEKIIRSVPEDIPICFAPDKYLGSYLIKKTGRHMVLWNGTCQVHETFSEKELISLQRKHPNALVLAHPECPENILHYADYIGSTSGIIKYATESPNKEFIIATEEGIIHQLKKKNPDKIFYPLANLNGCACNQCPHMRVHTLDKLLAALENLEPQITMDEGLRQRALKPLLKMLELSK